MGFRRVTTRWPVPVPTLPIPRYPRGFTNPWQTLLPSRLPQDSSTQDQSRLKSLCLASQEQPKRYVLEKGNWRHTNSPGAPLSWDPGLRPCHYAHRVVLLHLPCECNGRESTKAPEMNFNFSILYFCTLGCHWICIYTARIRIRTCDSECIEYNLGSSTLKKCRNRQGTWRFTTVAGCIWFLPRFRFGWMAASSCICCYPFGNPALYWWYFPRMMKLGCCCSGLPGRSERDCRSRKKDIYVWLYWQPLQAWFPVSVF